MGEGRGDNSLNLSYFPAESEVSGIVGVHREDDYKNTIDDCTRGFSLLSPYLSSLRSPNNR